MFIANKPIISVNMERLKENGISERELRRYFPRYILNPTPLYYSRIKKVWFFAVRLFLTVLVKIFLRPRKASGSLDIHEVEQVYTKEAATYDRKHHITTRGMDLIWRRAAGWFVSVIARNEARNIRVLDLCTGTGLTIKEIISILKEYGLEAEITGLDYNEKMLDVARKNLEAYSNIKLVRGDATNMNGISSNSLDVVTQVCGIGGISEPTKVFHEVLRILKPGGWFFMIDMHKPIPEQPGEWPFLLKWFRFPIFESVVYEESTIPVVLKRLWGWRDTTLCFYFLPLTVYRDDNGKYWGFKINIFVQDSQRWWFGLPIMPVAQIIVEKVEISEEEAKKRKIIIEACNPY